jgi:hypothetical protein
MIAGEIHLSSAFSTRNCGAAVIRYYIRRSVGYRDHGKRAIFGTAKRCIKLLSLPAKVMTLARRRARRRCQSSDFTAYYRL